MIYLPKNIPNKALSDLLYQNFVKPKATCDAWSSLCMGENSVAKTGIVIKYTAIGINIGKSNDQNLFIVSNFIFHMLFLQC